MSDYRKLYIVGAGGFGREVLWLAERINAYQKTWDIAGFIDDNVKLHGRELNGIQVVGDCTYFQNLQEEVSVILAVGSPRIKKQLAGQLSQYDHVEFATLIDPSVIMSEYIEIGEGTIICASSILTANIVIGKHVTINLDCTLGHDDIISDYVTLYPSVNVSGCVSIGTMSELGTGTQII